MTTMALLPRPNTKRMLLTPTSQHPPHPSHKRSSLHPRSPAPQECARLTTVDSHGTQVLVIQLGKVFVIGRTGGCDYVTTRPAASMRHCRVYALTADTSEVIVCLEDTSTNGTMVNARRLSHQVVILMDGDVVEIAGQVFRYSHTSRPGFAPSQATQNSQVVSTTTMGPYTILSPLLGSGAFSVVHLALNTHTLFQVACKKIRKKKVTKELANEVEILRGLKHPNVYELRDTFEVDGDVYIFLELLSGGDLFTYVSTRRTLPAPEAKFIIYQILLALSYLHTVKNCSHRDIKLENVILEGQGPYPKCKLADFGHAALNTSPLTGLKGTLVYNPPEILSGVSRSKGYDGKKADIWSSGILLSLLLIGRNPFSSPFHTSPSPSVRPSPTIFGKSAEGCMDGKDVETCENVVKGRMILPRGKLGSEDQEVRMLLGWMLCADPKTRYSAQEALGSAWIQHSRDELVSLYQDIVLG